MVEHEFSSASYRFCRTHGGRPIADCLAYAEKRAEEAERQLGVVQTHYNATFEQTCEFERRIAFLTSQLSSAKEEVERWHAFNQELPYVESQLRKFAQSWPGLFAWYQRQDDLASDDVWRIEAALVAPPSPEGKEPK